MNREIFINNFWRYYLMLEERFINATRYVELSTENYNTYSMEFVSQIQVIGSEVDVVMKEISGFSADDRKKISDYISPILSLFTSIKNQEEKVNGKTVTFKPYEGWNISNPASSLFW